MEFGHLELQELLIYALCGSVPDTFLARLLECRDRWDHEFARRLDELAYEFRSDLAVWEIAVTPEGKLHERRFPLVSPLDPG